MQALVRGRKVWILQIKEAAWLYEGKFTVLDE
jgi:hypothetical protein